MKTIFPSKLKQGDEVRIIAPSMSLNVVSISEQKHAIKLLTNLGFKITYGKYVNEEDNFYSTSVQARVEDFHDAFSDENVKGIICATGGFNSNQLLNQLNWDLIKNNPKIFCGKSDITTLNNAIYAKTGLVTYSGPGIHTLGQKYFSNYTIEYLKKCLIKEDVFEVAANNEWADWEDEDKEAKINKSEGHWLFHEGSVSAKILGANMTMFALLKGSDYFPNMNDSILFLEDDYEEDAMHIDTTLQSIILDRSFPGVKGIVFGRFQKKSKITYEILKQIISTKQELRSMPIIGNVDFGHTFPQITFPIGGTAKLQVNNRSNLQILEH